MKRFITTFYVITDVVDIGSLFYKVVHFAVVMVHPTDLISRVYRTHRLVYRCAKKTKQQSKNVQLRININLSYQRLYNYYKISENV